MGLREHGPDGRTEGRRRVVHGHHDRHQGHSASPCQTRKRPPFKHRNRGRSCHADRCRRSRLRRAPLAVRAAEAGHRVIGYDIDLDRVRRLSAGDSYVHDVPSSRLRAVLEAGAYCATADEAAPAGFDIAVITVPTPLRDRVPDLSYIEACARVAGFAT
ncbi:hypothetical protein [Streptomyces sp. NPDC031705]|uniref:hypothetical protein n=1 Tax=Streptomyces sp. NPDC031705 TaxID=3155729 RepID=UPI0033DF5D19